MKVFCFVSVWYVVVCVIGFDFYNCVVQPGGTGQIKASLQKDIKGFHYNVKRKNKNNTVPTDIILTKMGSLLSNIYCQNKCKTKKD